MNKSIVLTQQSRTFQVKGAAFVMPELSSMMKKVRLQ